MLEEHLGQDQPGIDGEIGAGVLLFRALQHRGRQPVSPSVADLVNTPPWPGRRVRSPEPVRKSRSDRSE